MRMPAHRKLLDRVTRPTWQHLTFYSFQILATDHLLSAPQIARDPHIQLDMARVVAQGFEIGDPFSDSSQRFTTARSIRGNANLLYWLLEETHSTFRRQTLKVEFGPLSKCALTNGNRM
jgi:hypothetical protein